jgi:hypothetical protein
MVRRQARAFSRNCGRFSSSRQAEKHLLAVSISGFDPFRKSATPKDISVERAPDVFQMSSLDSYTET